MTPGREGLFHLSRILPKESLHLFKRKIRQLELILDIERRDRAVIVKLRDTFNAYDADAMRASRLTREINLAECVQKIAHNGLWDAIKFINEEHQSS